MTRRPVRSRRIAAALAVPVLACSWALVPPIADGAEPAPVTVTKVGWWSDRIGAGEAGEGAFEVATRPDGTVQSIAAFEVVVDAAAVTSASIVLSEAAALAEFSSIALCPTTDPWVPADPGELDDAPEPDCSTRVHLTRTTDSMTWLGDITALVPDGGTVSVVVVPGHAPPTPVGTGMVVRVSSIEITAEGAGAARTTSTTIDLTAPGGGTGFEVPSDPGLTGDLGSGPAAPGVELPQLTAPADDLGSQPSAPVGGGIDDDGFFTIGPVEASSEPGTPWIRLLLIVPLSAAIGFGAAIARRLADSRRETGFT